MAIPARTPQLDSSVPQGCLLQPISPPQGLRLSNGGDWDLLHHLKGHLGDMVRSTHTNFESQQLWSLVIHNASKEADFCQVDLIHTRNCCRFACSLTAKLSRVGKPVVVVWVTQHSVTMPRLARYELPWQSGCSSAWRLQAETFALRSFKSRSRSGWLRACEVSLSQTPEARVYTIPLSSSLIHTRSSIWLYSSNQTNFLPRSLRLSVQ